LQRLANMPGYCHVTSEQSQGNHGHVTGAVRQLTDNSQLVGQGQERDVAGRSKHPELTQAVKQPPPERQRDAERVLEAMMIEGGTGTSRFLKKSANLSTRGSEAGLYRRKSWKASVIAAGHEGAV